MRQRAIEFGKNAAVTLLSAGLLFCSTGVMAEDAGQQVAVATTMPTPRAAMPVMTVGGLKAGQLMVIGAGTAETMSAAVYAQRPVVTPAMKAAEPWCNVK